jgi:hypothetical protein
VITDALFHLDRPSRRRSGITLAGRSAAILAILIVTLSTAPPEAPTPLANSGDASPLAIGVNLDFNSDHATAAPWVDVHRLFRRWGKVGRPWEEEPGLRLTPQGYPLGDAEALTYLYDYPDGRYHLSYRGTGRVSVGGIGRLVSRPVKSGGRTSVQVEVRGIGPDQLLTLRVEGVRADDPVRDLRLIAPGYSPNTKETFTRPFLRRVQPFTTLRFMDWMMTNNSPLVRWSDRTPPDSFLATGVAGVAYEDIVALANESHKDLWINVPDLADDDFVANLARLVHDRLETKRAVYVEYSNELWNGSFPQYQRTVAAARTNRELSSADDFGRAGEHAAFRTAAIAAIFRREFGADAERVRPVLCGQAANPYFLERGLAYLASRHGEPRRVIAAIAVGPYVALDAKVDKPGLTKEALFSALDDYLNGPLTDWIRKNAELARAHRIPLFAYEGGQHLVAWNPEAGADVNEALKREVQDDPRMGRLLDNLLATWKRLGGGLFNHYSHIAPYSKWGFWGLLPASHETGSVKWDTMLRHALPPGDATLDGRVDFADFQVLRDRWGEGGRWWEDGDFNGNGSVDEDDLALLKRNLSRLSPEQQKVVSAFSPAKSGLPSGKAKNKSAKARIRP